MQNKNFSEAGFRGAFALLALGVALALASAYSGAEIFHLFADLSPAGSPEGFTLATAATGGVKETVEELKSNLERILGEDGLEADIDDAKDAAHDAKRKVEEISEKNAELVDELREAKEDKEALQEQVDHLEVELKEGFAPNDREQVNLGEKVVQNMREQDWGQDSDRAQLKTHFEDTGLKDITTASGGGALTYPTQREEVIPKPQLRTPTVLDFLTVLETEKDAVKYIEQDTETDAAAPQTGQGSTLGQTDMTFTQQTVSIETIGHYAVASVQILDDAPRLRTYVNTRMRQLLELELEDQVLTGDGTGNNLEGIIPNATAYDSTLHDVVDGTVTDLDRVGVAILQVQRNNFPPTAIMLSPFNWWAIQLQKDDQGQYQFVNPQASTTPRLWGLPVGSTNAMPEGELLVGNFEVGATFYDRMQSAVELSTEDSTNFRDLLVTIRAYLRGAVIVNQPKAIVHNANMDAASPSGS